jgi:hypothetical protein
MIDDRTDLRMRHAPRETTAWEARRLSGASAEYRFKAANIRQGLRTSVVLSTSSPDGLERLRPRVACSDFILVGGEGRQDFLLLALRDLHEV